MNNNWDLVTLGEQSKCNSSFKVYSEDKVSFVEDNIETIEQNTLNYNEDSYTEFDKLKEYSLYVVLSLFGIGALVVAYLSEAAKMGG